MIVCIIEVETETGEQLSWSYPGESNVQRAVKQWLVTRDRHLDAPIKRFRAFIKNTQKVTQRP